MADQPALSLVPAVTATDGEYPERPEDFPFAVKESLRQLQQIAVKARSRHDPALRWATDAEIALATLQRSPLDCTARSGRTGLPCRGKQVKGGSVCRRHGAQYAHVKAANEARMAAMAGAVIGEMYKMAMAPEHSRVKQAAAADLLDRAGVGQLVEAKTRASYRGITSGHVSFNVGFLQTKAVDVIDGQAVLPPADVIDVTPVEAPADHRPGAGDAPAAADERDSA